MCTSEPSSAWAVNNNDEDVKIAENNVNEHLLKCQDLCYCFYCLTLCQGRARLLLQRKARRYIELISER
jgi:hypothetical protein